MPTTPHNTPRRERSLLPESHGYDSSIPIINGNIRVGGGFDASGIGLGMLREEERRAADWTGMDDGGRYNPDLEKHLMERKTDIYAANSFLFNKKALVATGAPQIFEYTKASAVAHHLRDQPDHYARSSSSFRSPTRSQQTSRPLSRSGGGSRILSKFDPHRHETSSIYEPHTSFIPLVASPISNNKQLIPAASLSYDIQQHQQLSHVTVTPTITQQLQAASAPSVGIANPTAAVFVDTSLNGTNHLAPYHVTSPTKSGSSHLRVSSPAAAGSSGGNDISRPTMSSSGKNRDTQNDDRSAVANSSYSAAAQYEQYIRSKAGIGQVSSIENTDALLDSLAAGEPDPHTGYGQPSEFKATNSSTLRVLKNSHHIIDRTLARQGIRLGCCGSSSAAGNLVPAAGAKVDGLFVTYCQQDVHSQLDEAKRSLIHEQGQRDYDTDTHNEKMAALLHENQRLRVRLHEATVVASNKFEVLGQQLRDALALKEEYDRRANATKKELEDTLAARSEERNTIIRLTSEGEEKDKRILGLEVKVFDLERNLAVAEKQVQDVHKMTRIATEEKMAAEGQNTQLQKQIKELGVMLMNADKAYQGSEYGRRFAEDKISQMAFLMSTGQQRVKSTKATKR